MGVIEIAKKHESPRDLVRRLAWEKARSVYKRFPGFFVLGADTVVVRQGRIFGKPRDRNEAARMLMDLQNRVHEVWTGVALLGPGGKSLKVTAEKTKVYFKPYSLASLSSYLKSKEPYDKAGGYNIQGTARNWVEKWEGDYFNIVGLPIRPVLDILKNLNLGKSRDRAL